MTDAYYVAQVVGSRFCERWQKFGVGVGARKLTGSHTHLWENRASGRLEGALSGLEEKLLSEKRDRRDDRILDPGFLDNVESVATADLRNRRDECRELEAELSYARRLLQGKIDILGAEIKRRSEGGEAGMGDLVSRLPSILADEPRSGGATRLLESDLPRNAGKFRRYTERLATGLAHIETSTPEELSAMVEELATEERRVSEDRRRAQRIIDGLNAELVRRYQKGDEDPSALLTS